MPRLLPPLLLHPIFMNERVMQFIVDRVDVKSYSQNSFVLGSFTKKECESSTASEFVFFCHQKCCTAPLCANCFRKRLGDIVQESKHNSVVSLFLSGFVLAFHCRLLMCIDGKIKGAIKNEVCYEKGKKADQSDQDQEMNRWARWLLAGLINLI